MAIQSLNTIKNWFRTGLIPTQAQFWDTWDSFRHKSEKVPVAEVDGIDALISNVVNIVGKPVCVPGQRMLFKHPTNNDSAMKYEQQANDFIIGFVGDRMIMGYYLGGEQEEPDSYDIVSTF